MFRQSAFREATRLLEVTLTLITEKQYDDFGRGAVKKPVPENVSPTHPILYYTGDSAGLTGTSSSLRGYVFMDTDGNVQWHFVRVGLAPAVALSPIVLIVSGNVRYLYMIIARSGGRFFFACSSLA